MKEDNKTKLYNKAIDLHICHIVPDGPEEYLGVPGPLAVALVISAGEHNSFVLTSSTEHLIKFSDSRLQNINLKILKKFQFRKKLASGISLKLWMILIRDKTSTVYHFHFSRSLNSLAISYILIFRGKKIITQTHGSVLPSHRLLIKIYDMLVTRRILERSSCVIALQSLEISELKQICPKIKQIEIVRNAVQTRIRERIPSYRSQILVGFVGQLRSGNNPAIFLKLAKLLESDLRFRFVMIGPDGGERQNLEKLIKEMKISNISLLGNLDIQELELEYDKMDALICTARTAQALSFIDGLARGALGVTSKENASWEFFEKYGVLISENSEQHYREVLLSDYFLQQLNSVNRIRDYLIMIRSISPETTSLRWAMIYSKVASNQYLESKVYE